MTAHAQDQVPDGGSLGDSSLQVQQSVLPFDFELGIPDHEAVFAWDGQLESPSLGLATPTRETTASLDSRSLAQSILSTGHEAQVQVQVQDDLASGDGDPAELEPESRTVRYLGIIRDAEDAASRARRSRRGDSGALAVDLALASCRRNLEGLAQLQLAGCCSVDVDESEDEHMLLRVALNKIVGLFELGGQLLTARLEGAGPGCTLIRFGVLDIALSEQKMICRNIFLRELDVAAACVSKMMMMVVGCQSGRRGPGTGSDGGLEVEILGQTQNIQSRFHQVREGLCGGGDEGVSRPPQSLQEHLRDGCLGTKLK